MAQHDGQYPGENDSVTIAGGAAMSLGAIPLRIQALSKLRIVPHEFDCSPGHRLQVTLLNQGESGLLPVARGEVPCAPFQIANVPRGTYRLQIDEDEGTPVRASQLLEVSGESSEKKIDVTGGAAEVVRGSLQVAGLATDAPFPRSLVGVPIHLLPRDAYPSSSIDEDSARAGEEGTFKTRVFPNQTYSVESFGLPSIYYIKSVLVNGVPLADSTRFTPSGSDTLQIVLSDKPATFQGQAVSAFSEKATQPVTFFLVKDDLVGSRRETRKIKILADAGQAGSRSGLTPGKYHVICLPAAVAEAVDQPSVLDRLIAGGKGIELTEGQVLQVDVPVQTP